MFQPCQFISKEASCVHYEDNHSQDNFLLNPHNYSSGDYRSNIQKIYRRNTLGMIGINMYLSTYVWQVKEEEEREERKMLGLELLEKKSVLR